MLILSIFCVMRGFSPMFYYVLPSVVKNGVHKNETITIIFLEKGDKKDMKKLDFIKELAATLNVSQKDIREFVDAYRDVVYSHIMDEGGITVVEGLTLSATYVEPHEARNPSTGEMVKVLGKYRPKVKVGKPIKDAINA